MCGVMCQRWRILTRLTSKVKAYVNPLLRRRSEAYDDDLVDRTYPSALLVGKLATRERCNDFCVIEIELTPIACDIIFCIITDMFDVEITESLIGPNGLRASGERFRCKDICRYMLTGCDQLTDSGKGRLCR